MTPKSGNRFSGKIMLEEKFRVCTVNAPNVAFAPESEHAADILEYPPCANIGLSRDCEPG